MKNNKGMSRQNLYEKFREMGFKRGAEIGVWSGENARNIFAAIPDLEILYLVDPYREYSFAQREWKVLADVRRRAHRRLKNNNVRFLEMFSEQTGEHVPNDSLDFVYIDGTHAYNLVMRDILIWEKKVKKGGIISGHDYTNSRRRIIGVKAAVDDFTRLHGIEINLTDGTMEHRLSGGLSSWWWVKEHWMYPY